MTPNPIHRVLSTLRTRRVRFLLGGGQACILYGAAEFSRDADILILADAANLRRLRVALDALDARLIAVPSLAIRYLKRGHAVHFRCCHPDAEGIRLAVMSVMRGVASFTTLWRRRTTVKVAPGESFNLMALPDLVQSKKTQRDKDWPMLRRLVEAHYVAHRSSPTHEQVLFWLREARTPSLLMDLVRARREEAACVSRRRPLLRLALAQREHELLEALEAEEKRIREIDRAYWEPLRHELERLRQARIPRESVPAHG